MLGVVAGTRYLLGLAVHLFLQGWVTGVSGGESPLVFLR